MLTLSPLVMTVCAHFLFIRIGPAAEAGRSAEVYFSEQAEAGDPSFVSKIAGTKLWVQTAPGSFKPLEVREGVDRLRAPLPDAETLSVVGSCEYGVLARPKEVPFLLRHYPKAIAGDPEALNQLTARGEMIPLEIMGQIEGDKIHLVLLKQGKPVPGVVFHAVDADLTESEAKAGPDGTAVWTPPAPGPYSIYARDTIQRSGEAGGKSYEEIREFATLAFAWPLGSRQADPEAVSLFEQALAARAQWNEFPGFSANLAGESNGRPYSGSVRFLADGKVELKVDDPVARPWLKEQFESLAMHRRAEAADPEDKPVLRFADDREDHPLGRLLTFDGGRFASSYRIKDQQIRVVNRRIGPKNMTITVLDNDRNAEGKFLPHSYVVHHWDASTGNLERVETVQERWQRIGSWDLPVSHTTSLASGGGFSVRHVTLSEHELLKAN
ncbi:Protein of unknown function [Singulisphaera sp. GP187]|uniref:DUF3386 family protein n=1 Tax=Singulisphaera sp. GP187 TaxID=1882752 RepID=UPI00092CB39A|nr:DUF3386 family protein [Singulisphaera sp. GP187]SIO28491.1 Protein of unknown function [Singulisphaera sp. GP187]